jgi:hypothetical protein
MMVELPEALGGALAHKRPHMAFTANCYVLEALERDPCPQLKCNHPARRSRLVRNVRHVWERSICRGNP